MKKVSLVFAGLTLLATASFAKPHGAAPNGPSPITVSGSTGADGSYASLTQAGGAFSALNAAGSQAGNNILVTITADATTEDGANSLNNGGWTTITVNPVGARTVSGNVAAPLINQNAASNVTIDGLNTAGNSLTISNASATATASTIRFIADASNNTVTNCTIAGSSTVVTVGTVFFSTGTATGNINNTISNNAITSAGGALPANAIFSSGTSAAIPNSGIIINNNTIQDYFSATLVSVGINVGATGNSAWTITNNKLFQTALRLYTTANTHSGIFIGTGAGYTISGNTIGFANAAGTGFTTMVGNSVPLSGTFPSAWNNTGTANATRYIGINCAFTAAGAASSIQNNTIAGFANYTSSGAATSNGVWCGINVTSGNANIGTTTGNTIGATSGQGSVYSACNTAGGAAVGIFVTSANTVNIQNNTIGAIDSAGAVVASGCGGVTGIDVAGAGTFTISGNTVGNSTANNLRAGNLATGATLSNTGTFVTTTGVGAALGIRSAATGGPLNITGNTLRGFAMSSTASSASSAFTGITNTGAATTAINITGNFLGTAGLGLLNYTNAIGASSVLTGINCSTGGAAAPISVSTNDIRGISYAVAGANNNTYISWSHAQSVADNVNSNTFTNLNVNTSGSVTFLNRGTSSMTATGSLSVSSNSIVTGFNKGSAGGTVTFFTNGGGASSPNGSTILDNLNNFSNVTLTGATAVLCWSNADGPGGATGGPTKTISNNTFNNITTGIAQITGISFNFSGNGTTVSNNTLSNLTSGGVILSLAAGTSNGGPNQTVSGNTFFNFTGGGQINVLQTGFNAATTTGNITGNTITNISSTSAAANPVFPIISSGFGVTTNISKNKVGNVQSTGNALAGSVVFGILAQTSGTTYNIFDNLVGDLRLPANPAANNLQGISIGVLTAGTTVNLSYNTVWLNESVNAVAGFGSSAVFASTTPAVVMRDNILVNRSVFNTTGLSVAYRRSDATLGTYGAASNNNDFYAGTPGANNLIYNDGTNSDQTITAYKARVASRDSSSFSENPTFLSTTATPISRGKITAPLDANFLHIDPSVATQLESGGVNVAGITDDFDAQTRQGNPGYAGSGTAPDVGADEFEGIAIDLSPPNISYTLLSNTVASGTRSFTNVTVTDASGVNTTAGTRPRVYYKKTSDVNNTFNDNTNGTVGWKYAEADGVGGSPFSFTIDYSLLFGGGGVTAGDVIQYFVVAQDNVTPTPNVGINSGTFAVTPTSVALTAAAFPIGGSINSYSILSTISGTFNVGAAQAPPYNTLTGAIGDLNNKVINGAITFVLTDATYPTETLPLTINANSGSSASNTVTIKPQVGISPTIGGSSASCVINLNGADYVTIDGSNGGGSPPGTSRDLTIANTNASTTSAVICVTSLGAGQGATFNTVKNTNVSGNTSTTTFAGIFAGSSTISTSTVGMDNNSNRYENNSVSKAQYGIFSQGASAAAKSTGTVITQNQLNTAAPNGLGKTGIYVAFEDGVQITLNNIDGIASAVSSNDVFGISLGLVNISTSTFTGNEVTNASVLRNYIGTVKHTTTYSACGIGVAPVTTGAGTNLLANNMVAGVFADGTVGDFSAGMLVGGGAGTTQIYFNSISMSTPAGAPTDGSDKSYAVAIGGSNPIVDMRDNILSNTQSVGTGNNYDIGYGYSAFTNLTSDYNDFFNTVNATHFVGGTGSLSAPTGQVTFSNLQGATGKDLNSKNVNPAFVSATNLHLQANSPVIDMGIAVGGILIDFDGDTRPQDAGYEIGADEVIKYTVSYDANGGTGSQTDPNSPYLSGSTVTVLGTGTITRTGYTFANWNTAANGSGTSYSPGATFSITGNTILYAQWTINSYTVTYDANGGTGSQTDPNSPYPYGSTVTVLDTGTITRTGYTFANWNTAADGSGTSYNPGNMFTLGAANVVLYAQWTINSYTVTYDANGGTGSQTDPSSPYPYGSTVTVLGTGSITRTGYTFSHWNTAANDSGTSYNPGNMFTLGAANVTLYAQWRSANANLSNLTLSAGTLDPVFDPATTSYTASVGHKITSITVTPTVQDPTATVTVNGTPVTSGTPSDPIALNVGDNTITILVSAQDEMRPNAPLTTKTYTVVVNRAAVPVVSNTNDSGAGSLRFALANVLDGETINFTISAAAAPTASTIILTSGELVIDNNITINGPGANIVTVMRDGAAPAFRIFHVMPGHIVTIGGLTINNGLAQGSFPANAGGGIFTEFSTLTVNNCVISGNAAGFGGGIFSDGNTGLATLNVDNSTLSGNSATNSGGGIYSYGESPSSAVTTVTNSTLSGNLATFGGGILNDGTAGSAMLTVSNCTLSANSTSANFGNGGGIYNFGESDGNATVAVRNSTLNGNSATEGGAIYNDGESDGIATVNVSNSTLSANSADDQAGGIFNDGFAGIAVLNVSNSTLSGNLASPGSGGAIYNDGGAGKATLDIGNTILNGGASTPNILNDEGTVTSHGYNLSSDSGVTNINGGVGSLNATGDQINTDPMLGPLKNNGGPTKTHAPLIDSPAIDQGKRDTIPALTSNFDQRGFTRPVDDSAVPNAVGGDASDIGAVELAEFVHPTDAASRKTHGGAGDFDVVLPLTGAVGIECRGTGAATNAYTVIVNFAAPITLTNVIITSGTGTVDSFMVTSPGEGAGGNQVTINLSGVTDIQTLTLGLLDVDDGSNTSDVGVRMRVRIGDVTDNDVVNSSDVGMVKMHLGEPVDGTNFRADVNANGAVNASDVTLVKSKIP